MSGARVDDGDPSPDDPLDAWRRQRRAVWLSRAIVLELVLAALGTLVFLVALVTQPEDARCDIYDDGFDEVAFAVSGYASMAAIALGLALGVVLAVVTLRGTGGGWLRSSGLAVVGATIASTAAFVGWAFLCFAPGGLGF